MTETQNPRSNHRAPLAPGEIRTHTVGARTFQVMHVAGGSFTQASVREPGPIGTIGRVLRTSEFEGSAVSAYACAIEEAEQAESDAIDALDDADGVAFISSSTGELVEPQAAESSGTASDAEVLQLIDERDDTQEWADRLAQAIAEHLGVDIGEHSNFNLPWQAALIALGDRAVATDAKSGPLVLTLPEVPAEAVALVDKDGHRWERTERETTSGQSIWRCPGRDRSRSIAAVIGIYGPVTVEMAPPREPRTWPKISSTEDEPSRVEVDGLGTWKRSPGTDVYVHETEERGFYSFADLRELGEVREVLGDA